MGAALASDACGWAIAVARNSILKQSVGGWSRMLRDLLKMVLLSPTGIQIAGLPIELKGEIVHIYAKVGCLLSDGDGLRIALQQGIPGGVYSKEQLGTQVQCIKRWC